MRSGRPWRPLKSIGRGRREEHIIDQDGRVCMQRKFTPRRPENGVSLQLQRNTRCVGGDQRKGRSFTAGRSAARPCWCWFFRLRVNGTEDPNWGFVGRRLLGRGDVGVTDEPVTAACLGLGGCEEAAANDKASGDDAWHHRRQAARCHLPEHTDHPKCCPRRPHQPRPFVRPKHP